MSLFEEALGGTALGKARKSLRDQMKADEERAQDTVPDIEKSGARFSDLAADESKRAARVRGLYGRDRRTLRNPPAVSGPAFADPVTQATRQAMIDADNLAGIQEEAAYLAGRELPVAPGIAGFDVSGLGQALPALGSRANAADLAALGIDPTLPVGNDPRFADSADPGVGRLAHLDNITGGPVGDPTLLGRKDFAYYPSEFFGYPQYREGLSRAELRRLGLLDNRGQ